MLRSCADRVPHSAHCTDDRMTRRCPAPPARTPLPLRRVCHVEGVCHVIESQAHLRMKTNSTRKASERMRREESQSQRRASFTSQAIHHAIVMQFSSFEFNLSQAITLAY